MLITGGAGFLGRALVYELLRPEARLAVSEVRIFDRQPLDAGADPRLRRVDLARLSQVAGDVRDAEQLEHAAQDVDLVFHCAALVDWGQHTEGELAAVNVGGTENVIAACRAAGVRALVHVSTLDVVYGGQPIRDGDETLPYPERYPTAYCRTKAEAEQIVLGASGTGPELVCCVVRPCSVWGEADPHHIGSLLRMARRFPLIRIGSGKARSQAVYVGNVAHVMILAARGLLSGTGAAGEVYFAVDHPPRNFFDQFEPILRGVGLSVMPQRLSIPYRLMFAVACGAEALGFLLRPVGFRGPTISRFAVNFVCQDLTFATDKAARQLGYRPIYTEQEAIERTVAYFRDIL